MGACIDMPGMAQKPKEIEITDAHNVKKSVVEKRRGRNLHAAAEKPAIGNGKGRHNMLFKRAMVNAQAQRPVPVFQKCQCGGKREHGFAAQPLWAAVCEIGDDTAYPHGGNVDKMGSCGCAVKTGVFKRTRVNRDRRSLRKRFDTRLCAAC